MLSCYASAKNRISQERAAKRLPILPIVEKRNRLRSLGSGGMHRALPGRPHCKLPGKGRCMANLKWPSAAQLRAGEKRNESPFVVGQGLAR